MRRALCHHLDRPQGGGYIGHDVASHELLEHWANVI
jgi:hypothetical protein